MKPMDLKHPIDGETLDDHLKNYKHQPWQEFYHRFMDDIHNSTVTDVLMGYHEWLQSRGMIRDDRIHAEPPIYKPTDCRFYEGCQLDGFKTHHWACNAFGCHTATEVDPDSRTITVSDAGGVAPAPTVEMILEAYNGAKATPGGGPVCYLLRTLYPSAFKE